MFRVAERHYMSKRMRLISPIYTHVRSRSGLQDTAATVSWWRRDCTRMVAYHRFTDQKRSHSCMNQSNYRSRRFPHTRRSTLRRESARISLLCYYSAIMLRRYKSAVMIKRTTPTSETLGKRKEDSRSACYLLTAVGDECKARRFFTLTTLPVLFFA